jgi:hypothetical protein
MKALLLFLALFGALIIGSSSTSVSNAAGGGQKQRALMQFAQPVKVQGVILKGEYLFVHDDEAMARGEACTYIYKGNAAVPSKLVVSFHCTPAERTKVSHFTVRTAIIDTGMYELKEFQFADSTEAHLVPAN